MPQGVKAVAVVRRTKWFGIYLHELLILACSCAAYGMYQALHQLPRAPLKLFLERAVSLGSYYLLALPLTLLILRLGHIRHWRKGGLVPPIGETWRIFRQHFLTRRAILEDARALLVCVALFVLFIQLKHLVPFVRHDVYDDIVGRLEKSWFAGSLLSVRLAQTIRPAYAELLSEGYFLFYPYVAILVYTLVLQRSARLREEFLTGFILCWLLGIVAVYIFPTLGPCFVDQRFISGLPETGVRSMQISLLANREKVLSTGQGVYLISGFPSLHIVMPVFGTAILWRVSRLMSAASVLFVALTFITTLYFGWHYLIDNIGGFILGVLIAVGVRRHYSQHYIYVRG